MAEEQKNRWEKFEPYRFRILFTVSFLILAFVLLAIGFWRTLLLALFAAIGYGIGKMRDEDLDVYTLIEQLRSVIGI